MQVLHTTQSMVEHMCGHLAESVSFSTSILNLVGPPSPEECCAAEIFTFQVSSVSWCEPAADSIIFPAAGAPGRIGSRRHKLAYGRQSRHSSGPGGSTPPVWHDPFE